MYARGWHSLHGETRRQSTRFRRSRVAFETANRVLFDAHVLESRKNFLHQKFSPARFRTRPKWRPSAVLQNGFHQRRCGRAGLKLRLSAHNSHHNTSDHSRTISTTVGPSLMSEDRPSVPRRAENRPFHSKRPSHGTRWPPTTP